MPNLDAPFLVTVAAAVVLVAILSTLLALLARRRAAVYEKRDDFLTPAEHVFFGVLDRAVAGEFRIMCKVRLADIVKVAAGITGPEWRKALNRITNKHVDFVLCDPATLEVRLVLELDDKSHEWSDRIARDTFVDQTLAAAGIPILHVPVKRSYSVAEVRHAITSARIPLGVDTGA